MSQVFGLFALVCRWWKTSGGASLLLLSSPPSLPLTAPWGVSMVAPLLSTQCLCVCARARVFVCVACAAVAAASSLCLLSASAAELSQHASNLSLLLSLYLPLSSHHNLSFLSFFLSFCCLLIRESAHTYTRGVWRETWGSH